MPAVLLMVFKTLGGGWIKYLLIAAALGAAFLYVRNMGVQAERTRWEKAVIAEQARQNKVNAKWVEQSILDADGIAERIHSLTLLREEADLEANTEHGSDVVCLPDTAVMRLNAIR